MAGNLETENQCRLVDEIMRRRKREVYSYLAICTEIWMILRSNAIPWLVCDLPKSEAAIKDHLAPTALNLDMIVYTLS